MKNLHERSDGPHHLNDSYNTPSLVFEDDNFFISGMARSELFPNNWRTGIVLTGQLVSRDSIVRPIKNSENSPLTSP